MLQGINQQQKTVLGLVIGIIVKIVLNIVLLPYFDYVSFIISTYAGYTISVGFNLWMLSKYVIKGNISFLRQRALCLFLCCNIFLIKRFQNNFSIEI